MQFNAVFDHGNRSNLQFGDVFVTVTTYKHLMVEQKSSKGHPVFGGPCFVQTQQETQTYFSFLSYLIGKKNGLHDLKAYESDGEVPLLNALAAAFPDAIGLRCFIHMKDSIEDHLRNKLHVKSEVKSAIINDILGHVVGGPKGKIFNPLYFNSPETL